MTKTGVADLMKCASKIHFRTRRVRYTSRRQVLDHSRAKGNLSNSVYNVSRKISICLNLLGHRAGANVNCRMKCHMAKKDEKRMRPMADSKKNSASPMTFYHFFPIL